MNVREPVRQFCSEIGKDPLLVQGAGGNVSWKQGEVLWIKASGSWLADASEKDIFVPVNLTHLIAALKQHNYAVVPETTEPHPLKPSIETLLHALMPQRIVVHVHAIEVLAHLIREDFSLDRHADLDSTLEIRIVDYHKPGAELAQAIARQLHDHTGTRVVFLRNHGVIIGGDCVEEIRATLNYLTDFFATPTSSTPGAQPATSLVLDNGIEYGPAVPSSLHELANDPSLANRLCDNWALYPDHVVFLGPRPLLFSSVAEAKSSLEQTTEQPDVVFIRGAGTFIRSGINKAKVAQLVCYHNVMSRIPEGTSLTTLNDTQISELIDWDAEKYRRRLNDAK